jgi:hypothetical protein
LLVFLKINIKRDFKMKLKRLKKLVQETVREERRKSKSNRNSRAWNSLVESAVRSVLLEAEEEEKEGLQTDLSSFNTSMDINAIDANALAAAIFNGDQSILDGMADVADWAPEKMKTLGFDTPESLKAKAKEIWGNEATCAKAIGLVNSGLAKAKGFAKPEMPAFEGVDGEVVKDALDSTSGDLGVDFSDEFKDGQEDFVAWAKDNEEEIKSNGEVKQNVQDSRQREGGILLERWSTLAGINEIKDDKRFPFEKIAGPAKVVDGAPNIGNSGSVKDEDTGKKSPNVPNPSKISGVAKAFLTKGKGTGDKMAMAADKSGSLKASAMIPTQTNIKAAKSIFFALADIGKDMEGGFATTSGEILDGHHRWSGQYIRHMDKAELTGLNMIDRGTMPVEDFLTMLTTMSAAMGRPTKLK